MISTNYDMYSTWQRQV